MAWRAITEDDVVTAFSGGEIEPYREAALAAGQIDPIAPVISQVAGMVRGYVAASGRYTLGDGETIPEKLLASALALIAVRIPARVGLSAGKDRLEFAKEAIALLQRVADGKFGLEEPETADDEITATGTPSFTGRDRRTGRTR